MPGTFCSFSEFLKNGFVENSRCQIFPEHLFWCLCKNLPCLLHTLVNLYQSWKVYSCLRISLSCNYNESHTWESLRYRESTFQDKLACWKQVPFSSCALWQDFCQIQCNDQSLVLPHILSVTLKKVSWAWSQFFHNTKFCGNPLCFPTPLFVSIFLCLPLPDPMLNCKSVSRFCSKVETYQCAWAKVFCRHVAITYSGGLPSCSFQLIAPVWFLIVGQKFFWLFTAVMLRLTDFLKFCLDSRFFFVKRRDGWVHNSPRVSCSWYQSVESARNWLLSFCDKVCMFLTYRLKDCAQFRHRLRFVFERLCSISV